MYQLNDNVIAFVGRDRVEAKRRAVSYWYRHGRRQGRSLPDFLGRCRLCADDRTIVFRLWA